MAGHNHQFPREIAPGIFWMGVCSPNNVAGRAFHVHLGQFLLIGEQATFLIDTGMPDGWDETSAQLDQILGDRPLDYLMPTHPEVPHVSALPHVLKKYPACRLIGDSRDYHLYYPTHVTRMIDKKPGEEIDLGGLQLVFVEALMKDLPNTLWAYEKTTGTLFVCDGFSFSHTPSEDGEEALHRPGECALTTSEMLEDVNVEQASFILQRALYWSRFVDAEVLFRKIERLLERYPAKLIAPAHGNVIDNIEQVFPTIRKAHEVANQAV